MNMHEEFCSASPLSSFLHVSYTVYTVAESRVIHVL
jgi:hypothetical protein